MVSRRGERRRAATRSDGAGDGDAQRAPLGAHRAASRRQPRRLRLLHELQQPQGRRPASAIRARRLCFTGRCSSGRCASKDACSKLTRRESDAIFSNAPARKPAQRMGVAAERGDFGTIVSRRGIRARRRRASAMAEFRVRRSGVASELSQIVSSSGRDDPHRLHDRLLYRRKGNSWTILRLAP